MEREQIESHLDLLQRQNPEIAAVLAHLLADQTNLRGKHEELSDYVSTFRPETEGGPVRVIVPAAPGEADPQPEAILAPGDPTPAPADPTPQQ